jgi:hypothetical protein
LSFLKKAKLAMESGSKVLTNLAAGEELLVSDEVAQKRMEVCKGCPHFVITLGQPRCNECSCLMALKTKLAGMKCPLHKWEE